MAAERLSKLQKWILVNTYRKIILRDNSSIKRLPGASHSNHYWKYLFRSEILWTYYKCQVDPYKYHANKDICFTGDNNKAQVAVTNSIKNLEHKGLIEVFIASFSHWQGLVLTNKGKEQCLLLINEDIFPNVNNKVVE